MLKVLIKIVILLSLYYFYIIYRFFSSYFQKEIEIKDKYIENNKYYIIGDKRYTITYPWFKTNETKQLLYESINIGGIYKINGYDGNKLYSIII
jgi:hypothetical protein